MSLKNKDSSSNFADYLSLCRDARSFQYILLATFSRTALSLEPSPQIHGLLTAVGAWPGVVWFPDPSIMRMRGRGKKGLGNNYTVPSHRPRLEFERSVRIH